METGKRKLEIKSKYYNQIVGIVNNYKDSPEDRFYEIKSVIDRCDKEILYYKSKK